MIWARLQGDEAFMTFPPPTLHQDLFSDWMKAGIVGSINGDG